jgi:hypothetical protein
LGEVPPPSDARLFGFGAFGPGAATLGGFAGGDAEVAGVGWRTATTPLPLNSPGLAVAATAG